MSQAYARQGEKCVEVCMVVDGLEPRPMIVQITPWNAVLLAAALLDIAATVKAREDQSNDNSG